MLPSVGPGTVTQGIADVIVSNGYTIVACQQIPPVIITVTVLDLHMCEVLQRSGGIVILPARFNVAGIIVGICVCFAAGY